MAAFIQRGVKNILHKRPQDVVILSSLRTPVTKAYKGGLKDAHDHELLYHVRLPRVTIGKLHKLKQTGSSRDFESQRGRASFSDW